MKRLRIATTVAGGLDVLCVMRRARLDLAIMGGWAYDSNRPSWPSAQMAAVNIGQHRTPSRNYDTIIQFTNGLVAMIHDDYVDQALMELGIREVTR